MTGTTLEKLTKIRFLPLMLFILCGFAAFILGAVVSGNIGVALAFTPLFPLFVVPYLLVAGLESGNIVGAVGKLLAVFIVLYATKRYCLDADAWTSQSLGLLQLQSVSVTEGIFGNPRTTITTDKGIFNLYGSFAGYTGATDAESPRYEMIQKRTMDGYYSAKYVCQTPSQCLELAE